eukprot:1392-Pelagomonas_calceolata.AAC.1
MCRGYNIGIRLIDEFLAKSKVSRCSNFRETVDIIAKQCTVSKWTQDGNECSLVGHVSENAVHCVKMDTRWS